ncbi:ydjO [Escherichia coli]|nr:ydjO [Escherichia coli]CTW65160.1 ydjO [Escherichia coli]
MMSLWDALRMNMMISYQELVRTFHRNKLYNFIKVSQILIHFANPLTMLNAFCC